MLVPLHRNLHAVLGLQLLGLPSLLPPPWQADLVTLLCKSASISMAEHSL